MGIAKHAIMTAVLVAIVFIALNKIPFTKGIYQSMLIA